MKQSRRDGVRPSRGCCGTVTLFLLHLHYCLVSMSSAVADLNKAQAGFDLLWSNDLDGAKALFSQQHSPFHHMGTAVCLFLQAALGAESDLLAAATQALSEVDVSVKAQVLSAKGQQSSRYGAGLEWDVVRADAAVLTGLSQAIGETYMGYMQCMYSLNKAHSQFTKLFKTVFPDGLSHYSSSVPKARSAPSSTTDVNATIAPSSARKGLFSRWLTPNTSTDNLANLNFEPQLEEFIVSGTAYGYGLFNLVFSLLPARVKSVVGWFGFSADLAQALQALSESASRQDVHASFARLTLMSYYGLQLQICGWLADEERVTEQYTKMVSLCWDKYPGGSLWSLHRAKIMRLNGKVDESIACLRAAIQPETGKTFRQANIMLHYDLAWVLLAHGQYREAAEEFVSLKGMNKWSPAVYNALAGGCFISAGDRERARPLLEEIPVLLEAKKGQREFPMETFIRRQLGIYNAKVKMRAESAKRQSWIDEISINPAHQLGLFLNAHYRLDRQSAESLIAEWTKLTPPPLANNIQTQEDPDLLHPEEFASRSTLLGVLHSVAGNYADATVHLQEAANRGKEIDCKWAALVANVEMAVLSLLQISKRRSRDGEDWSPAIGIAKAEASLDTAMTFASRETEMGGRVESRINLLRNQIALKKDMIKLGDDL
ncbi:hypothetical protein BKA62DRAFT_684189 [Auriculariales sp. MPI-PUGE-AT-0066]|nr:hypothetical protein BKA62DRAFT_684189 [Auriculariales sp. MPI-PUGE-AT-0066]